MVISPENFTTALLTFGILFSDETLPAGTTDTPKFVKSLRMYTEMFTDIALQSMDVQQYSYSVQAIASVVAARKAKKMKDEWSPWLSQITGY